MKYASIRSLFLASLTLGAALAQAADAQEFRAATWSAVGSPNDKFLTDFANQLREATNGEIDFGVYPGGALLPADGTLPGVASGVAQIANITAAYIPSDMPVDAVAADLSFAADDQFALAFAKTEASLFNEQMQEENRRNGVVFATAFSTGLYYPICSFDVTSLDDLNGRKVRTGTAAQVDFADVIGAVAVSVPASEIYTGLQRRSLDCTFGDALFLTDLFKLTEVANSVYLLPLGANSSGGFYMDADFWQDRTPDERRTIMDVLSRTTARMMIEYKASLDAAWTAAEEASVALNPAAEADEARLAEFQSTFVDTLAQAEVDKRGVDNPTKLIDGMVASMEKWKGLLADVDTTDVDAVAALLDQEIFGLVDVETYGIQ